MLGWEYLWQNWLASKRGQCEITPPENLSPQQHYMKEQMRRQEHAQLLGNCVNPDCGCLLSAFPLEEAEWILVGQNKIADDEGMSMMWRCGRSTYCPVCGTLISMEPLEFAMLASDDAMMSYRTPKVQLEALDRNAVANQLTLGRADHLPSPVRLSFSVGYYRHVRGAVIMCKQ